MIENGYLMEGFIPFDPVLFPAGEWRTGRAIRLAVHILDRDDPAILGTGYSRGLAALAWGATRVTTTHKVTGKAQQSIRTNWDASGWKTLTLENE